MTLTTFERLLTPVGQAALAAALELRPTEASYPASADRLAKAFPVDLSRAALDTVLLREKARPKFARAAEMYFSREALEMASGEVVASHRAKRFAAFPTVADLCCGIGGDALALAAAGRRVVGVDTDALRLRMAAANLAVHGLAGRFVCADVLTAELPPFDAAFADPGRRPGGKRTLSTDRYEPPVSALVSRFGPGFPLGVKVAPGVPRDELPRFDAEAEFLAVQGELKECVLWFGPLRTAGVRATVLPGGHSLTGVPGPAAVGPPGAFVYDTSPAVSRSGLVRVLAEALHARQLDPDIALLTADTPTPTPFATPYRVEEVLPFHVKRLTGWLRERGVGRVTVLKRGSTVDSDELTAKLKLRGDGHRELILTRCGGKPAVVVAARNSVADDGASR